MTIKEFTFAQQATLNWSSWMKTLFGIPEFKPVASDCPGDRFLFTTEAGTSTPIEWPAGWAETKFDFHAGTGKVGPGGNVRGWPIQRYAPDARWENWTQIRYGERTQVEVPTPNDRPMWLEGMPVRGGAWDRHWLGVCPERDEAIEMIWAVPGNRECSGWGRWQGGVLVEGRAVCRGGVSLTERLWNRDDSPHRMALHISGDDKLAETHFEHPTVGDVFRLSTDATIRLLSTATTEEQRRWILAAQSHGMEVVDRNGNTEPHMLLATVSGTQWIGHSLYDLDVSLSDLELVTG